MIRKDQAWCTRHDQPSFSFSLHPPQAGCKRCNDIFKAEAAKDDFSEVESIGYPFVGVAVANTVIKRGKVVNELVEFDEPTLVFPVKYAGEGNEREVTWLTLEDLVAEEEDSIKGETEDEKKERHKQIYRMLAKYFVHKVGERVHRRVPSGRYARAKLSRPLHVPCRERSAMTRWTRRCARWRRWAAWR